MTDRDRSGRPGSSRTTSSAVVPPASPRPGSVHPSRPQSRQQPSSSQQSSLHRPLQSASRSSRQPRQQSSHGSLNQPVQRDRSSSTIAQPLPVAESQPEPASDEAPPFRPLYTLLTSTTARGTSTHHPRVHYLFSDDDPEDLTRALAQYQQLDGDEGTTSRTQQLRAVIVDLVPREDGGGYDVAAASSLTSDWAVVGARLGRMEGDDGTQASSARTATGTNPSSGTRDTSPGTGLMLRIEGVGTDLGIASALPTTEGELQGSGGSGSSGAGSGGRSRARAQEDYAGLMDEFERRMDILGRVLDAAEERRRRVVDEPEAGVEEQAVSFGDTGMREQTTVEEDDGGADSG